MPKKAKPAPVTEAPDKDKSMPVTGAQDKAKPVTAALDKAKPVTEAPNKDKPVTAALDKAKPVTEVPNKDKPVTGAQDKAKPVTEAPNNAKTVKGAPGAGEPPPPAKPPSVQMIPMGILILSTPRPQRIPEDTPPGLEYLLEATSIIIEQQGSIELLEVFSGIIDSENRYQILDHSGRRMYYAAECSDAGGILCLGSCRAWQIHILNHAGQVVMVGHRDGGCGACSGNTVHVEGPTGERYGMVVQNFESVSTSWAITDGAGVPVLHLEAPICSACCPKMTCGETDFPVITIDGDPVGNITKFVGGVVVKEMPTTADSFGITFPIDLDVKLKATLIFAVFLIATMFFKNPGNKKGSETRGSKER